MIQRYFFSKNFICYKKLRNRFNATTNNISKKKKYVNEKSDVGNPQIFFLPILLMSEKNEDLT